ncbi:AlkA N-terminal domain-containing protein [Actinocatenispora rupis]|uniref:AlkA N-terminal domain-containing protein n=1 Tax=Actinocatenispora rupis TaxID=519421 RepID=UPI0033766D7E
MGGVDDFETLYRAMASRDVRFDGRFVVAVTSTGVYCRPSCPSRTPLARNVRFFALSGAAEAAGFRACRRCRPDAAPASPEWRVRGDLVARALRLIADGAVDRDGVAGLARRLSVSERHLHRQLLAEVGAGPQALAVTRRAQVARMLVESSALPMSDVAFAAGYASVRQFNAGMRVAYGCAPSALRRRPADGAGGALTLRLRYREPLPTGPLLAWLAERAVPGVESVRAGRYERTLRLPRGHALVGIGFEPDRPGEALVRLSLADVRDLAAAVERCREILDLDADPATIAADLSADPVLAPLVARAPGLRVPGCADGVEGAARAVLRRHPHALVRLVERYGERFGDRRLFPTPDALARADLGAVGLTGPRADTLRAVAAAVADGALVLDRTADRADTLATLRAIPGIGPSRLAYVARHALGDPDVFPPDPLLRKAVRRLGADPDRWRPWRSYAAGYVHGFAVADRHRP